MFQIYKFFIIFSLSITPCFGWMEKLSLEEKVGQLLVVPFHGEIANEDARVLVQDVKVGGIIYYNWANGLNSSQQVRALSAGLQQLAKETPASVPLLIAIDQEGGRVARLKFTQFPSNRTVGDRGDPQWAEEIAQAIGQELQTVGVNMNLAPVVDVNSNPQNPVIGTRSFGSDPKAVVAFGEKALSGYERAGIIATLKHFPGYGDVAVDPHEDLPVLHKSKEQLQQVELLPFAKLASSAEAIMTAHILVPALDPENCSTLSEKTLTYLRETIGFQGVIITDSLIMGGVVKACGTVDEAAIRAFQAGCDILLLGGRLLLEGQLVFELTVADVQRIHRSLVNAVQSGLISEERLNQSVERILDLKHRYRSGVQNPPFSGLIQVEDTKLFYKVYGAKAPSAKGIDPLQPALIALHGGPGMDHTPFEAFWSQLANEVQVIFIDLRGHGKSEKSTPDKWNLAQWGDDVYHFAKAIGLEGKVFLAGLSFGGWVAQSCATRHPGFLTGLILTDTEPRINRPIILADILAKASSLGLDGDRIERAIEGWFDHPNLETLSAYFQDVASTCYENHPLRRDDFSQCIFNWELAQHFQAQEAFSFDFRESLAQISCPVLQITGDYSPWHSLKFAKEIAEKLPHVQFEVLEGAGVLSYNHAPDKALALMKNFIQAKAP